MDIVESDLRIMGVKRWKTRALESYRNEKIAPIVGKVKAKIKRTILPKQKQKLQLIIQLFICSYFKI
jgi:hypothetical protein